MENKHILQTENLEKAKNLVNSVGMGMAGTRVLCQAIMLLIEQIEADTCDNLENWGNSQKVRRVIPNVKAFQDAENIEGLARFLKERGFKYFKIEASLEEFEDEPKTI